MSVASADVGACDWAVFGFDFSTSRLDAWLRAVGRRERGRASSSDDGSGSRTTEEMYGASGGISAPTNSGLSKAVSRPVDAAEALPAGPTTADAPGACDITPGGTLETVDVADDILDVVSVAGAIVVSSAATSAKDVVTATVLSTGVASRFLLFLLALDGVPVVELLLGLPGGVPTGAVDGARVSSSAGVAG